MKRNAISRAHSPLGWGALLLGALHLAAGAPALAQTGASIWTAYQSTPNTHANIPNNSYAGYRAGEVAIPSPAVVNKVTDFGAVGDGATDCTAAFEAAIRDAAQKGGGAVSIPAGEYLCGDLIHLKESGVVLRGAGQTSTTIHFTNPLSTAVGPYTYLSGSDTLSRWSWHGGLLWFGPGDVFNGSGQPSSPDGTQKPSDTADYEQWRSGGMWQGTRLATISSNANRGSFTVSVNSASSLQAGKYYLLRWTPDLTNYSLWKTIAGGGLMDSFDWAGSTRLNEYPFRWPVQIKSISGTTVTLAQPLPVPANTTWNVGFEPLGPVVQESGVENLTIKFSGAPTTQTHNANDGYNAIYMNRTVNCWVKNVTIQDAENGILTRFTKNNTVDGVTIKGYVNMHHGTTVQAGADNLQKNLAITSKVRHGLSTEHLASGNVWSKVTMDHGTFDSHRLMPFDIVRTEVSMYNDGTPGGGSDFGPFVGKNVVHWNVNVNSASPKGGLYVNQPDAHSKGALVGVRGVAQDTTCAWAMVCGDKSNLIADAGATPTPTNLHDAQFNHRKSNSSWVHLTAPFDAQVIKPGSITLKAEANVPSGRTISKIEFFNGSSLLGSDTTSPYSYTWANVAKGTYTVSAKLTDSSAATLTSYPANITVADVQIVENTDSALTYSSGWALESKTGASGGSWTKNRTEGASIQYTFTGTQVDVYVGGLSSNHRNYTTIYVDNVQKALTGYYLTKDDVQTLLWSSGQLSNGSHTLKIVVRKKDAADTNAPMTYFDYLRVVSTGSGSTNAAPTVSLTSPSNGSSFTAPATISLAATASDDVSVSKVEFFNGSTLLNSDTTSPYAYTWSSVAAGTYSLTAKATDGAGLSTTSSAATVTVGTTSTGNTLNPAADAYVQSGGTLNFGTATDLRVKYSSTAGTTTWRESYLKFNTSGISGTATNVKLRLYGRLNSTGTATSTGVYSVSDTGWTESGINWSNKPASGSTALASKTINSTTFAWHEFDITSYVNAERAAGRNTISLVLKNAANTSPYTEFSSKEATSNRPELVFTP